MRTRSSATAIGLVVLLVGLVLLFVGASSGSEERALARRGVVAQGTVIEKRIEHVTRHKKGGGIEEHTLHVVRYRFNTRGGASLEGEREVGESLWRRLQQDGSIAVRYLEANPFANRPDAEPGASIDIFLISGGVLTAGGLAFLVVLIQRRQRARTGESRGGRAEL